MTVGNDAVGRERTPTPPAITLCDVLTRARADLFAKEVQTSPTYSYQWMADQVGHVALKESIQKEYVYLC